MSAVEFPLSWETPPAPRFDAQIIPLPVSRYRWYALAELPDAFSLPDLLRRMEADSGRGMVIRGCPQGLADRLSRSGFECLITGQEAVLELDRLPRWKKAVRYLVRLGQKTGTLSREAFSAHNLARLEQLRLESAHGSEPQLRHLFRTQWQAEHTCFVFRQGEKWLGALTVSYIGRQKALTELLLRHRNAPQGVMESLVDFAARELQREGVALFSLGEAPFVPPTDVPLSFKERLFVSAAKRALFAYNYRGLYRFKNKFSPQWRAVYLCGRPRLGLLSMAEMFWKSNLHRLSWHKLIRAVQGRKR